MQGVSSPDDGLYAEAKRGADCIYRLAEKPAERRGLARIIEPEKQDAQLPFFI